MAYTSLMMVGAGGIMGLAFMISGGQRFFVNECNSKFIHLYDLTFWVII